MTVNFDRAAAFYDNTRSLPPEAMTAFLDHISEGLGSARDVLEVGVGTGRIAVPLSARGYTMTGVDISEEMLAVLAARSSAVTTHQADATDLPLDAHCFDAVLAVDFFHLVAAWQHVVDELVRVLRPGGCIVLSTFAAFDESSAEVRERAFQEAGTTPRRGVNIDEVAKDLTSRYEATRSELPSVSYVVTTSLATELESLRQGIWSRYWTLSDELRERVADNLEAEFRATGRDLDAPVHTQINLSLLKVALAG